MITWSGWWFGTWILFSHILEMSSSQLTFIFFRGVATTNQWLLGWSCDNMIIFFQWSSKEPYESPLIMHNHIPMIIPISHYEWEYSQVIKHGWLENGPFSSVIFRIKLPFIGVLQPAMFESERGLSPNPFLIAIFHDMNHLKMDL